MAKRSITDGMVFRAAELFVDKEKLLAADPSLEKKKVTTEDIVRVLNNEIENDHIKKSKKTKPLTINRENFYRLIRKARELNYFRLIPPVDKSLPSELAKKFGHGESMYTVVDTLNEKSNEAVSHAAADLVLGLLSRLHEEKEGPLTLGLGPGRATLDFCRHMGMLLRSSSNDLKLNLVAISAGGPANFPEYASSSFFNLFPPDRVVRRVGLFAEPLVPSIEFKEILPERPGISEAFAEKNNVDVIINSMGDIIDMHDLLGAFLWDAMKKGLEISKQIELPLREARGEIGGRGGKKRPETNEGCVGNIQYRPYTANGPIIESDNELRSCSLYELSDFTKMASQGKYVVLIARQCGACGLSRARALRPLLEVPELKVWSHIVMDVATGRELLSAGTLPGRP